MTVHNAKKIVVEGKTYSSIRTAAKAFNFIKVDRSSANDIKSIGDQAKRIFKND